MSSAVKIMVGVITAAMISGLLLTYFMGGFRSKLGTIQPDHYQPTDGIYQDREEMEKRKDREKPIIHAKNGKAVVGETIPVLDYLESIIDAEGNDLKSQVKVKGDHIKDGTMLSLILPGIYHVTYGITDSYGLKASKQITIVANYPKKK